MNNKGFTLVELIVVIIISFCIVGEVMCITKCINSDWEPSYKREIIYGASALTGIGSVVGYFNIPDVKKEN